MNQRRYHNIVKSAATFAGTVIGAGFASGQEITRFFVCYGQAGLIGVLTAACLFAWLGGALLEVGYRLKGSAYFEAIYYLCGNKIGKLLDIITTLFLFTTLSVMLAGAATVMRDYYNVAYFTGLAIACLVIALTVLRGIEGIAAANLVITPLLVVAIIAITGYSLAYHDFMAARPDMLQEPVESNWLIGCLQYVSYNLVISSTVLIPLGNSIPARKDRIWGGLLGGAVLGLLAMSVTVALMMHRPELTQNEIPLLELALLQHPWSSMLYTVILLAAIYTTASASLYGCARKVGMVLRLGKANSLLIVLTAAFFCSQAGFSVLIKVLFPIFGYLTLFFMAKLAWEACRGN